MAKKDKFDKAADYLLKNDFTPDDLLKLLSRIILRTMMATDATKATVSQTIHGEGCVFEWEVKVKRVK